jgi:hypothetical protein
MPIPAVIIVIILTLINLVYLISKDNVQKGESDIKECLDILKKTFETTKTEENQKKVKILIAQIESLSYLRLVKENNINIKDFCIATDDFQNAIISEEDYIGKYKESVDKIYNMKFSVWKYIDYTLHYSISYLIKKFK